MLEPTTNSDKIIPTGLENAIERYARALTELEKAGPALPTSQILIGLSKCYLETTHLLQIVLQKNFNKTEAIKAGNQAFFQLHELSKSNLYDLFLIYDAQNSPYAKPYLKTPPHQQK